MTLTCRLILALTALPLTAFADDFALSAEQSTHRGKPEPLQWTPHSITVIEAAEWNETVRWDVEDLEGLAPGLIVDPMSGTPQGAAISIRGIASRETNSSFFPAVAVKVDDVYIGTHASQNQVLFDFDRVEIKRGPQGAFEGAPAIGGAIAVVRRQPSQELTAHTELELGDYDRKRFAAVGNLPYGDRFAARVSMIWEDGGDFIENTSPDPAAAAGRSENDVEQVSTRATFQWKHSEDLTLRYTADITRDNSVVPARANISTSDDLVCDPSEATPNCAFDTGARVPEAGFLSTTQDFSNRRQYDVTQHAFHIAFRWQDLDIKSVTAWRDTEEFSAFDYDGTFDRFYSGIASQDYSQFTQEVTASGIWSERINYTAGLFYLSSDVARSGEEFFILPQLDNAGRIIRVTPTASRTVDLREDTDLISFFAHANYEANDQWILDAGIRWTSVDKQYSNTVSRLVATTPAPLPAILTGDASSAAAVGTVGATYRVDDEASIYIRYSRDFRPVAFNESPNSADGARPLGEESVDGFEVGLKSEWYDDRLRLNYVGYQNKWRNKVERYTARVSTGRVESILANTSRVEVRGHELEIEAVPLSNLLLRASIAHQNADYDNYAIPDLAGGPDPIDLADLNPIMAPSDIYQFSALYTYPFKDALLKFYASYRATFEYTSEPQVPAARINQFSMLDLSVDYVWRDWTIRLFSRNLNDKRYLSNVNRPVDAELASLATTFDAAAPIVTTADFNEPEYTGIRIIYVPPIGR